MQPIHDGDKAHSLREPIDIAVFSGASNTLAHVYDGGTTNFNLITREDRYDVEFRTFNSFNCVELAPATISFVYSLQRTIHIIDPRSEAPTELPEEHLLLVDAQSRDSSCFNTQFQPAVNNH